jgi:hypothetical protein
MKIESVSKIMEGVAPKLGLSNKVTTEIDMDALFYILRCEGYSVDQIAERFGFSYTMTINAISRMKTAFRKIETYERIKKEMKEQELNKG